LGIDLGIGWVLEKLVCQFLGIVTRFTHKPNCSAPVSRPRVSLGFLDGSWTKRDPLKTMASLKGGI